MILETGAGDLLAVIQVFGADEAYHAVDQQRREGAGNRVGARLDGLLIDAVVCIGGQRAALAGLEIHDVVANVPRRDSAAWRPRAGSASETPKLAFAASVPPIDWNTRSTGALRSIARSVVVTCASTQVCVGMA